MAYRLLRLAWRAAAFLLRFHVEVSGLENLPRDRAGRLTGGWIAAGLPHRTWIDPFLVWMVLPAEPRLVFFGDARTMARSPLRRWVVRRVGGILPIPSHGGPRSFATHLAAAGEVLRAGAVFCLFPESGMPAPVGTARPISPGVGIHRPALGRVHRPGRHRRQRPAVPGSADRGPDRGARDVGGAGRGGCGRWRSGPRRRTRARFRRGAPPGPPRLRGAPRPHGTGGVACPRGCRATAGRPTARDAPDAPLPLNRSRSATPIDSARSRPVAGHS